MKILHIINNLQLGGAEALLRDIINPIKEKNIQIDVLLLDGKDTSIKHQIEQLDISLFCLGKNINLYNPFLVFKLRKYIENYDIVHVHLFPAQYWVAFVKILFKTKTKLITTEHNTTNRRRKIKLLLPFERMVYKSYNKIICISEQTKDALLEHINCCSEKVEVVNNGVKLDRFINASGYKKIELLKDADSDDIFILQIARFTEQKDQQTVIKALPFLPENVRLLFAGQGATINKCVQLAKELNVEKRVHFLGNRSDIERIIKTCDIVVVSSNWEGFGLAAVEGMAACKPVIASNVAGLANVVYKAGLLFEKGNVIDLVTNIFRLINSKDEYIKISNMCKQRALDYDIKDMIEKYCKIYNLLK